MRRSRHFCKIVFSNRDIRCACLCDPGGCGAEFSASHSARAILRIRRRCISKAMRLVPRSGRFARALAGRFAETIRRPNSSDARFWIDDGRGLPHESRGARGRCELSGNEDGRIAAARQRILLREHFHHVRSRKRHLGGMESFRLQCALPDAPSARALRRDRFGVSS